MSCYDFEARPLAGAPSGPGGWARPSTLPLPARGLQRQRQRCRSTRVARRGRVPSFACGAGAACGSGARRRWRGRAGLDAGGSTWSAPVTVGDMSAVQVEDAERDREIRTGEPIVTAALDPQGRLYAVWQNPVSATAGAIRIARSDDGGRSFAPTTTLK